nr:hypothetical protein [Tanacetum cinerariifolium]
MQKRKNDVKARTTLLLSLPDEHQLRFSKYKTAQELWAAILKTFGGNEATKKTKKNLIKQQYGNFKVEGSETLEQTFNRLQVILSQLEFMDIEIEHDDLNQKFLTSLAPEWLMHTIKKSKSNSQNMTFISLAKHSSGNEEVNIASVFTTSTYVSTASANIGVANISQDTACAYIASQLSGSQIKFEDINQIDKDDMEEMDIKWNMALLSMRADRFWKKTGKKISIQGIDVAGFDKSKVECFNCHKMGHFAREANCIKILTKDLELLKKEKGELETKLTGFQTASKDLDNLLESQRLDKNKEGLGYSVIPPPPAQVYSPPKKDMSWTGLLEFKDDTITDYSRPSPAIGSTLDNAQNKNPFVTETEASPGTISPKPFIKFVKVTDRSTKTKTAKVETAKPAVKYAAMYNKSSKSSKVRGNQRNWNNLKSHQLGDHGQRTTILIRGSSQNNIDDKGYWDSGCSRHMTGNTSYLSEYEPFDGGYVSFGQGG